MSQDSSQLELAATETPGAGSVARLRFPQRDLLFFLIGLIAATVACWGGLSELVSRWHRQEEYSHGFFIPLISLWLLWSRRAALVQSKGEPSPWGPGALALSAFMIVLGEFTAIFLLIQLGFLVALAGLVLTYGGTSLLRVTAMPIALLLFCIPLPYFVDSQLSWRLQLFSSTLGVDFLRLLGYSVFREGNVIDLGSYMLQVVEACSGLRYLYPLLSVGFLMAYMYPAALRWRILLVLSTIPITIITNSARIAVVGILVGRWGSGMADGFLHAFQGWAIFVVCQIVLIGEIALIEHFTRKRPLIDVQQFPVREPVAPSVSVWRWKPAAATLGIVAMLCGLAGAQAVTGRTELTPGRESLRGFPMALDGWKGTEAALNLDVEQSLGFQDYVLADYAGPAGEQVNFYVAYYASQRKGVSPHSPQVCIPGGGWVIMDLREISVPLAGGQELPAVRALIDKQGQRALVYYWFDQRGRLIANEYLMKWYLLVDSFQRNRTDGALVRAVTGVSPNEPPELADQRLRRFIALAQPKMAGFVPH